MSVLWMRGWPFIAEVLKIVILFFAVFITVWFIWNWYIREWGEF